MKLSTEKQEALVSLVGYVEQLKLAIVLDKVDMEAERESAESVASETKSESGSPEVLFAGEGREGNFSRILVRFQRELYASDLLDMNYERTIQKKGRGRSGHEWADDPSGCDLQLCLAVLTFLIRAERFVWGFWDSEDSRKRLVNVLLRLRELFYESFPA